MECAKQIWILPDLRTFSLENIKWAWERLQYNTGTVWIYRLMELIHFLKYTCSSVEGCISGFQYMRKSHYDAVSTRGSHFVPIYLHRKKVPKGYALNFYFIFLKLIFIGVQLIDNVVSVSDVQQSELVLHKYIHLFLDSFPIGPLKYWVGFPWYIVVLISYLFCI